MLNSVDGLPLHPLVVHAVVVLLPVAALGVIGVTVRPAWRARFGGLVVAVAALAVIAIPLATESGERLEARVGDPGRHAELGDTLIWFALPLLAVAVALTWAHRRFAAAASPGRQSPSRPAGRRTLQLVLPTLAILIAMANLVQVYRVGDSGARAVWRNVGAAAAPSRR